MSGTDPSIGKCSNTQIGVPTPSIVALFRALDLSAVESVLCEAYSPRRRRPPYPPVSMLRALIFQKIRQIPSWRKLASILKYETTWLPVLGLLRAPCHDSFSEFTRRVGPERFHRVFRILQSQLAANYPDLGRRIAVDSTIVNAYSNVRKKPTSDPDARVGVPGQKLNKPLRVFGYKLQISCDADFELPLEYLVVSANESDSRLFPRILRRTKTSGNPTEVVIADAGYDSKNNIIQAIKHHAIPIIKLNPRRSRDRRKRRADYILPVKRNSAEWNRYYDMRVSVERVFSRLKEELGLNHLKLRRLERVEVHFALCLMAMIAIASTATATGFGQLALCIEPWRYYG